MYMFYSLISVNDSIVNLLDAFGLQAEPQEWPTGLSEQLNDFLDDNASIAEYFPFASLKIIKFTLTSN